MSAHDADATSANATSANIDSAPIDGRIALKRLSHDVKNALNGIAVNLEVARTRAARGVAELSQVTPFLDNAAQQLELVTKLHKQFADLAVELVRPH